MEDRKNIGIFGIVAILGWVLLMLIIFGMLGLFSPEVPEFRVDSFSLSNFTLTNGSRVVITSEIQLTARNPNILMFSNYDRIVTSIYYKHELLSQTGLSPFSQEPRDETSLVAKFAGEWNFVDKWVVDGISGEIGKNGSIGFDFWLISYINWDCKSWSYWSRRDVLKVFCGDLVVGIPSNGNPGILTGGPRSCGVGRGKDRCKKYSPVN